MSEEKKIECVCGSVVFQKNMNAHTKTAKHKACVSGVVPPKLERTKSEKRLQSSQKVKKGKKKDVNFAEAQHSDVADQDDEISEDDEFDEEDDIEDNQDEQDAFEDEVMEALEDIVKHLGEQAEASKSLFDRVEEIRLKVNLCLGETREVAMNQPYAKQINELTNAVSCLTTVVNEMKAGLVSK